MDYATAQIYAASGFKLVRHTPDWIMDGDFSNWEDPQNWIVKFVQSTAGGTYIPVIYINGISMNYTPTAEDSAATDWSVIP
jgi:hypothetical protein